MARIKVKTGENEVEVDSRDFYVDNYSIGEVIENISRYMPKTKSRIIYDDEPEELGKKYHENLSYIKTLDDAEVHEPEFSEPVVLHESEIKNKLHMLAKTSFFNEPRNVAETVSQLREYGWITSPLDVSKALTKMAFNKQILKNSRENLCYYFMKEALITN
ncbi:MAG TPA: hypothetical protein VD689_03410 [Nitrosopumilaceae archaeon]|nr:hypothetical protein [Nitrosopumilaceae archaeon]